MSAFGMSSRSSSTRLSAKVVVRKLTPVTLPPGRARLATRANLTGSSPVMNAMGIVDVAALAAIVAGAPVDAITATCRLTRSAANRGNRSSSPSAHSNSIVTFRPTSRPVSFTPSRKAAIRLAYPAGDALLRNPITGIADGCAFAPTGHAAAALPSSVMNSRRLTRSPRWQAQVRSEGLSDREPSQS